jgi:hypothetical protein
MKLPKAASAVLLQALRRTSSIVENLELPDALMGGLVLAFYEVPTTEEETQWI